MLPHHTAVGKKAVATNFPQFTRPTYAGLDVLGQDAKKLLDLSEPCFGFYLSPTLTAEVSL